MSCIIEPHFERNVAFLFLKKKMEVGLIMENVNELLKKPFLNEKETAELTGRAISTLRNERHLRRGIPYLKVSRRTIRYKLDDVLLFMQARRISFDDNQAQ